MTKQEAERQLTALRAQQADAQAQFHRLDGAIQILTQLSADFPDEPDEPDERPANVVELFPETPPESAG